MKSLAVIGGVLLILGVLWDTFETMILPRTVSRKLRLTGVFYQVVRQGLDIGLRVVSGRLRTTFLVAYGPLSLLMLIVFWAVCLIFGFAMLHWGLGSPLTGIKGRPDFGVSLYFSGVTFLTLGFGDVTAHSAWGRTLSVLEAGVGFGFLAVVISYLPVLYQTFSRREVSILLLDARAGTPPTAGELLRRHGMAQNLDALQELLRDKERWAAELLESYLSYPILAFYRSQHEEVSWLSAITAILDTCALIKVGFRGEIHGQKALQWQAQLTFAMARHTLVDLAYILGVPPISPENERLTPEGWKQLRQLLETAGIPLSSGETAQKELQEYRRLYEPYVNGLAERLYLEVPPWLLQEQAADNWQTSAWDNENHL